MNLVLTYYGKVEGGSLTIFDRRAFRESLAGFEGRQVELTLRRRRKHRSIFQNNYYWGVVVPLVLQGLTDLGWQLDKDTVHEFLKDKFHRVDLVNDSTGEIINTVGSTTRMTTTDMMTYFEAIKQWAAEILNVYIPDPGEQTQIDFQ